MLRRIAAGVRRADAALARIEGGFLVLFLGILVLGGFWQVVARNVNQARWMPFKLPTASWVETVLRHLVMWIGLVGASLATRHRKHVSIEVIGSHLPRWLHRPVRALLALGAAFVAGLFAWAAWNFVAAERALNSPPLFRVDALGGWGPPVWVAQSILPVAFGIIALRFCAHGIAEALGVSQPVHDESVHLGDGENVPDIGLLPGATSAPPEDAGPDAPAPAVAAPGA